MSTNSFADSSIRFSASPCISQDPLNDAGEALSISSSTNTGFPVLLRIIASIIAPQELSWYVGASPYNPREVAILGQAINIVCNPIILPYTLATLDLPQPGTPTRRIGRIVPVLT